MPVVQTSIKRPPGGFREFSAIAYPLVISNASMTVMVFVDRMFLSWAGAKNIAASIPTVVLLFTFWAVFIGISEYTNTFVAQFFGARRPRDIAKATWQGIYFSLGSILFILPMYPLGIHALEWAGHEPEITALEQAYYSVFFFGGPFFILNGALSSFYSGRGKTKVVMSVNIAINLLNGVLDYGLIFGAWGFPALGIRGAALATVTANVAASLIYFTLFLLPKNHARFATRTTYAFDKALMKRLIRFGFPSGLHFLLEIGVFMMFVFFIGRLGSIQLAASNIALTLNMFAWFPMLGANVATATLVGQYIGRQDYKTATKSVYTALVSVEIYMLACALIFIVFAEPLIHIFQSGPEAQEIPFADILAMGKTILLCVAVYQIFDAMMITFSGALRGAGDTAFAMWACAICGWCVFIPGTWLLTDILQLGIISAWAWIITYFAGMGALYFLRFKSERWKQFDVMPKTQRMES